jgi:hypothetical protein
MVPIHRCTTVSTAARTAHSHTPRAITLTPGAAGTALSALLDGRRGHGTGGLAIAIEGGKAGGRTSGLGRTQMVKRHETSAVRCNERFNPARSFRAKGSLRTSEPAAAGQTSMVVHDVAGPIVTGVLGGD